MNPLTAKSLLADLAVDPLSVAEKITGQSYKTDEATSMLGLGIAMEVNHRNSAALKSAGDTHFSMSLTSMLALLLIEGFDIVQTVSFAGGHGDEVYDERAYALFDRKRGLLAWVESYGRTGAPQQDVRVNKINVYFNLDMATWPRVANVGWSGGIEEVEGKTVLAASIDGREGLLAKLAALESEAPFLPQWVAQPSLWLYTYKDTEALATVRSGLRQKTSVVDYLATRDAVNDARIVLFPEDVRRAICA